MAQASGKKRTGQTETSFAVDGQTANASVKALRVLLCQEHGGYTAQGLEIDYAASGETVDEAMKNFVEGLVHTVVHHLFILGNLDKVLVTAPKEIVAEYLKTPPAAIKSIGFVATVNAFEEADVEKPEEKAKQFPFDGIEFIQPKHQKEAALAA